MSEKDRKARVLFEPDNITTLADQSQSLLEIAIAAGVPVYASCGGAGTCGTCKVRIEEGNVESRRTSRVSEQQWQMGIRQACQSHPLTDIRVTVLPESRLEKAVFDRELAGPSHLGLLASGWSFKPPIRKLFLELAEPTLKDNSSDLFRLMKGLEKQHCLADIDVDFEVMRKMSKVLRLGRWRVTATILEDGDNLKLINIEAGDTRAKLFGIAFDIGTTGVRGQLLDLNRGEVLAQGLDYNGQISYAADVISRIAYSAKKGGLKKLQQAVVGTLNTIIRHLLNDSGIKRNEISHIVLAANTTMIQLLLELDPKYLRLAPYVPTAGAPPLARARDLGIKVGKHVQLYSVPSVASYVGGDIVAGILGTGIYQCEKLTLYIDIGTNGEIALGHRDWMITASCSAGPAFEGGGIRYGMIATVGAIDSFKIDKDSLEPEITTIAGGPARGICGAGLISIVAGLLEADVISQKGKFHQNLTSARVRPGDDGYEYVVSYAADNILGKDIVLTEVDIDNLIRAKAAIYAGAQTLLRSTGADWPDVEQVVIAGTFGSNINIEGAITIGLLPDLARNKFTFIGNGALLGARLTAFSTDLVAEGKRIANMMTNLELSESSDFMHNYVAAIFLPHTQGNDFPTVKKMLASRQRKVA